MAGHKKPLPREMVFVRHGESEANVLQHAEKRDRKAREAALQAGIIFDESKSETAKLPQTLRDRPDWQHKLTRKGEGQSKTTGLYIAKNIGNVATYFAARYYSPFIRTRETAAHLGGPQAGWRNHRLMYERDWGEFGITPKEQQAEKFPYATRMKKEAPLFARLEGGESIAETVTMRVEKHRDDMRERWSDESVLTVTHGDVIKAVRYVYEHMMPEEYHAMDNDDSQNIANCAILWYSRVNPFDSRDVRPYMHWRRMLDPNNLDKSPFNGEWREIEYKSERSGEEVLSAVQQVPRLLTD